MIDRALGWIHRHQHVAGLPLWLAVILLTAATALVSIAASVVAVVYIPPDYFVGPQPSGRTRHRHPILYWTLRIARNLFGWFLVLLGVLMSLPGIPGQGLLTILIGLMLVEFPGKRRCEQALVRRPRVHAGIDAIRRRFGRPPLLFDDEAVPADGAPRKDE